MLSIAGGLTSRIRVGGAEPQALYWWNQQVWTRADDDPAAVVFLHNLNGTPGGALSPADTGQAMTNPAGGVSLSNNQDSVAPPSGFTSYGYFNGQDAYTTGGGLRLDGQLALDLGAREFTIEAYVSQTTLDAVSTGLGESYWPIVLSRRGRAWPYLALHYNVQNTTGDRCRWLWKASEFASPEILNHDVNTQVSPSTWHHVCLQRLASPSVTDMKVVCHVDGVRCPGSFQGGPWRLGMDELVLGGIRKANNVTSGAFNVNWQGRLAGVRFTLGQARYGDVASFTAPTGPLTTALAP